MCNDLQQNDLGQTFACRKCDDCIKTRKADWVCRAMAETAMTHQTYGFTLTYRDDPLGGKPDGAKLFIYPHVQTFLKQLRESYFRQHQARGEIRFLCAGERGSKRDRVHWHMIIWAQRDFLDLGQWTDFVGRKTDGPRIDNKDALDHWSFWDHGTVDVIEPSQRGISYVVKYALKDQVNVVRSKGQKRLDHAERFSASHFMMSKKPAIGQSWIEAKLDSWRERLVVPTTLHLKVPNYSGYYWPRGKQRDALLAGLHDINELCNDQLGRDAAQWSALLDSVANSEKDWEGLIYGTQEPSTPRPEDVRWEQGNEIAATRAIRRRCGGIAPCAACYRGLSEEKQANARTWAASRSASIAKERPFTGLDSEGNWRTEKHVNPWCGLRVADPEVDSAFHIAGEAGGSFGGTPGVQAKAGQ